MKFVKFLKSLFIDRLWLKLLCLALAVFAAMTLNVL